MSEASEPVTTPSRFLNRQLSWHEFNRRVLALAEDPTLPFTDRMRFVSIWANNLDEYFLVRVASMKDDARNGRIRVVDDGVTSASQFEGRYRRGRCATCRGATDRCSIARRNGAGVVATRTRSLG